VRSASGRELPADDHSVAHATRRDHNGTTPNPLALHARCDNLTSPTRPGDSHDSYSRSRSARLCHSVTPTPPSQGGSMCQHRPPQLRAAFDGALRPSTRGDPFWMTGQLDSQLQVLRVAARGACQPSCGIPPWGGPDNTIGLRFRRTTKPTDSYRRRVHFTEAAAHSKSVVRQRPSGPMTRVTPTEILLACVKYGRTATTSCRRVGLITCARGPPVEGRRAATHSSYMLREGKGLPL